MVTWLGWSGSRKQEWRVRCDCSGHLPTLLSIGFLLGRQSGSGWTVEHWWVCIISAGFGLLLCCAVYLVTHSYPTLCDPMDCSPPGSSVRGDSPGKNTGVGCHVLLQGFFPTQALNPGLQHCKWILYHLSHQGSPRILEWVAYPFSRGPSWPRSQTRVSCRWILRWSLII